ncbi:energy-coupling factor transport system ATP-binding protein [Agromyces ramosus]|uniref:Energy-coupling factor transport system ATP-binding protein n=1 Tax=Agromyces ramosus TaxID=33879 RepID=A0A4Q7MG24_9MICO|nr:ATP-binding cassette domain-containing protein [Agromyces ramosus]RZS66078.1 energy-coupling factor transport system ATP-binding protein [Agromyces ramosus]
MPTRDASSPRPASVTARGWGWRHGGRREPAVRDLDLQIRPGERVLLLGASGSGKSTLLHGLAGVLGGDDDGEAIGELLVDGRPASLSRGRSGLVLQDPDAQVVMARLGDDVAFGLENLGVAREQIWPRVTRALDAVGLDLPLDHATAQLSGGQRQRLALAGVLAMRPGIILLDEPTANLDPDGVREVRDAVARVVDETGATLVVIEHRVSTWLPVVDRVVVLGAAGGLLADGRPRDVVASRSGELRAAGVWLPGEVPWRAPRPEAAAGHPLLTAAGLDVARIPGSPLLRGADLRVDAGSILAITGPNGVGKSTLALTIAGLLRAEGGRLEPSAALADGLRGAPWRWRSRDLLTRIGTVFQSPEHQFLTGSVRAELEVGPRALRLGAVERTARVDELLAALRLERLAEANPFTLSGGEKRRLSVAGAIATRPRMLVLDEPTFGQDASTWRELARLIVGLRDEGIGVVAVTHDDVFVDAVADRRLEIGARRVAPAEHGDRR